MSGDLRDRVADAMEEAGYAARLNWSLVEAVCVVFAERERVLRARIEALREPYKRDNYVIGHNEALDRVLAVFDEAVSGPVVESCPECGGITAHVVGCPWMDVAR